MHLLYLSFFLDLFREADRANLDHLTQVFEQVLSEYLAGLIYGANTHCKLSLAQLMSQ
jgi:hypothetical protein